jgi:ferredoxin
MSKVVIETELCTGCGNCIDIAPDVFEEGDDDKAHVIMAEGGDPDEIEEAIESCPESCIHLK